MPAMRHRWTRLVVLPVTALLALAVAPLATTAKAPGTCTTGEGMVFWPNPVVSNGGSWTGLADNKDADSALLTSLRHSVALPFLDGSGYLRGSYAYVVSSTGPLAYSTPATGCQYDYTRHQDQFEQVMAYYWVTASQLYLQSLGFGVQAGWPIINGDQQRVRIDQWGVDNSFATTHPKDEMRFGKGGVDDAEDAEVILHELGHQIHFSQSATFFSSNEAGSISEGFGDYWAADVSEVVAGVQPDPACIAEWDSISYTSGPVHCLRRLDTTLMYPADLNGEVHHDGEIWSHALWNLRTALGHVKADTAILWAQFDWTGTTMPALATRIVAQVTSRDGAGDAALAYAAFQDRGILP
jgi:hypothetical protein